MLLKKYDFSLLDIYALDLGQSNISTLYENTIKGKFKTLSLEDNILSVFERSSFNEMPNILEISFAKNLITSLDFQDAFRCKLTTLFKLNFKFNRIVSISAVYFTTFPNLKQLE